MLGAGTSAPAAEPNLQIFLASTQGYDAYFRHYESISPVARSQAVIGIAVAVLRGTPWPQMAEACASSKRMISGYGQQIREQSTLNCLTSAKNICLQNRYSGCDELMDAADAYTDLLNR